jgi:signal recognition particle receptor subunit beta
MTSFASATPPETRVSQAPLALEADIPAAMTASAKFRSVNDPSLRGVQRFILQDTPGHGKLRPRAIEMIAKDTRGVVFVVDASSQDWNDAAEYLYTVLLRVQKLQEARTDPPAFNVCVACNKGDLFTALPAQRVAKIMEQELDTIRQSKSKGIVGVGEEEKEDEDWLGQGGDKAFTFKSLEEFGCTVEFRQGSTKGDGWRKQLGEWVGSCL